MRFGSSRPLRPYNRPIDRTGATCEWVSSSAVTRHEQKSGYAPSNLTEYPGGQHRVMDA